MKRISYADNELNAGLDLNSIFSNVTEEDLRAIKEKWEKVELESDSSFIEKNYSSLKIIRHETEGLAHYTAFYLPFDYSEEKKYPALVYLSGLDQNDPSAYLNHDYFQRIIQEFKDYIVIIPSFRGQVLEFQNKRYCSDGFFGDAYDGASTDGLRALYLGKQLFNLDKKRIAVAGQSRGGNVALLMVARDTSIRTVVNVTGPVDFYNIETQTRYGKQYKYQFLSKSKDITSIRHKMIASSPSIDRARIYFYSDLSPSSFRNN